MVEALVFVLMAIGAIAGAVSVVLARNPVRSALGLLGTLFSVAVLYVLQLAHFVAAVQVIVYAGAVLTLFLFVIMLIGVDKDESRTEALPLQRPIVGAIAGSFVLLGLGLTFFTDFEWIPAAADGVFPESTNGTIEAIGERLFTDWILAFEATALLLTIAAAGAIALAHYRRRDN